MIDKFKAVIENKEMKPKNIFFFIIINVVLLTTISMIFPSKGIKITKNFSINFITFNEYFAGNQKNVDISEIINDSKVEEVEFDKEISTIDTLLQLTKNKAFPIKIDTVKRYLEFPGGNKTILYKFFGQLSEVQETGKVLRIMHYGDSQIETDRISEYLRNKLQNQFGGEGPGFMSAILPFDVQKPMAQKAEGSWKRYTAYGKSDTSVYHRRYGVLGNFCKFSPIVKPSKDSTKLNILDKNLFVNKQSYKASLFYEESKYTQKNVKKFSKCRMFYGYNAEEVTVDLTINQTEVRKEKLAASSNLEIKTWTFDQTPKSLKFEFESKDSPEFYGFAFDGNSGISVDNIPLRGADGLMFTRMDLKMLGYFYSYLNTKLLILQFGGNTVPGEHENYDFYRRSFSKQIKTLKAIAPDLTIIVIGLADMSKKDKDQYITYPNVVLIRDALKKAAFENNCPYWDMFEAMGGANSMPSWVTADPPLAEKDYTHFTPQGSRIIAKMFYNAFIYEYNQYLNQK